MIYLILDVYYQDINHKTIATVVGIRFMGIENQIILNEYKTTIYDVEPYFLYGY